LRRVKRVSFDPSFMKSISEDNDHTFMKTINHLLLLITLVFPLLSSGASECTPINMVASSGSPFTKIPVYNQGKVNICYAYSAAQMADYHLIKQGFSQRSIHPIWVAVNFAQHMKRANIQIGHPKEALEGLAQASNCDYETVSEALGDISPQETSSSKLMEIIKSHCSENQRTKVNLPKALRYNFRTLNTDDSYAGFIQKKLGEADSPISIAYCANIWKDPSYQGISYNQKGERDVLKKNCQYHESLIVGQKEIGGSCNFLIRNTWGTNWTAYNKKWNCLCKNKNTGELLDDCNFENHEENYSVEACWLPMNQLSKNIGQVTVLDL
jgi:hypothetical protein